MRTPKRRLHCREWIFPFLTTTHRSSILHHRVTLGFSTLFSEGDLPLGPRKIIDSRQSAATGRGYHGSQRGRSPSGSVWQPANPRLLLHAPVSQATGEVSDVNPGSNNWRKRSRAGDWVARNLFVQKKFEWANNVMREISVVELWFVTSRDGATLDVTM